MGIVAASNSPQQPGTFDDEKGMATLVQVLAIFTGFLGPLIIWFMAKPEQPFVKHHAAEALNFQITVTIAAFVSGLLMLVLIGFLLLPVVLIGAWSSRSWQRWRPIVESGIGSRSTCGWCPGPRAEADVGAGSCQLLIRARSDGWGRGARCVNRGVLRRNGRMISETDAALAHPQSGGHVNGTPSSPGR